MGQTSGCFCSPKCRICFTHCHLNCYGGAKTCRDEVKVVVVSEAVWQCKNKKYFS